MHVSGLARSRRARGGFTESVLLSLSLVIVAALAGAGCGDAERPDPVAALPQAERARVDAFIAEIRSGFERGDGPAVAKLINDEGMPDFFKKYTRVRFLPKGPTRVVGTRVEALRTEAGSIDLGGTRYGLNVDPLGALILELDDVSVGRMEVKMTIGTHAGEYYIAGWKALD